MLSRPNGVLRSLLIPTALGFLSGCAVNPATGEREISLVSESQEVEMGRSADPVATAEFGGAYPDEDLQAYVSRVGQEMAADSERPDLPWTFRLVDHDLINAFALPGGFIYVTRGILATMSTEAELAGVLGHEIGHVTARHSASQITRQQLGLLALAGGAIFSETVRDNAGLVAQGMQLLFLSYGRDAEREADALGFRYMTMLGHHPGGISEVMATLAATSPSASEMGVPSWLLSHPDPGDRIEANERRIAGAERDFGPYQERSEAFLMRLDGLVYGEDPRDGYFLEERFIHPDLRFELTFPEGWSLANSPTAVRAAHPRGESMIELTSSSATSVTAALEAFSDLEGVTVRGTERFASDGIEGVAASFVAAGQGGTDVRGEVVFAEHRREVYRVLGYSASESWSMHRASFEATIRTLRALQSEQFVGARPNRIQIVRLDRSMTGDEFIRLHPPSTVSQGEVFEINGIDSATSLEEGRLMKQIVGGRTPEA